MTINLDYQSAVAQRAGIGRYTQQLAAHLPAALGGDVDLRLFYLDFSRKAEAPKAAGCHARPWRLLPGKIVQQLWKRNIPLKYDFIAGKADLYHFTNFIIPPISAKAKTVTTIFDMSFMRHPECAEKKNLAYMSSKIADTVKRADAIITISEFSKEEIVSFFPDAAEKTFSVYLGLDPDLSPPGKEQTDAVLKKHSIMRPYILSVGTLEPRKNYPFLARAFESVNLDVDLVIAGREGWKYAPILESLASSPKKDRIHVIKNASDRDLAALYGGASLYATASLYEGFGFPPLEAMLSGIPVLSSTGGSLKEVLGDAAEIVDVFDPALWAGMIEKNLSDTSLRKVRIAKGYARAARYTWEKTALETASVYRKVGALQ